MARPLQPRPLASLPTAKLSTGCPQLDAVLGGGLPVGSLTEVAGEAAASKTQLCLQLLLSAQLPQQYGGLDGAAVYVYTEGDPAMRRLHQLARWLHLRYPREALAALPDPTANIFVEKGIDSGAELLRRLQRLRGLLDQQRKAAAAAARAAGGSSSGGGTAAGRASGPAAAPAGCTRPVRLLVVDSIAHVLRDMGDSVGASELSGRTELLFKISALLRRYADEYGLAVLLVNQIVDSVTDSRRSALALPARPQPAAKNTGHTGGLRLVSLGREVVPALGLAWANCINTRLFLSRCGGAASGFEPARFYGAPSAAAQAAAAAGDAAAGGSAPALRKLQVVFSPHLPQRECYYVVEATGVRGLALEELEQHEAAAAHAAWEEERQRQQAWQQQQQQQAAGPQLGPQQQQHQGGQWGPQPNGHWGQQPVHQQQGGQWAPQQGSQWGQQSLQQQQSSQWRPQQGGQWQQQPGQQYGSQWGQQPAKQQQQQQHGGQWGQPPQQPGGRWQQERPPAQQHQQQGWEQQGWAPAQQQEQAWQQGVQQQGWQQQGPPVQHANAQPWRQLQGPQDQPAGCAGGGTGAYQRPPIQQQMRQPLRPQQQQQPQASW